MDLTSEVVSCSDKSVSSGGLYPPWVSITALASLEAARPTLGGYRPPLETLLPEQKKTSSVKSVSHVGKSHFGFFRNILLIFLIDFWLSLIEILRMQLDFFVWFLELFSILLFFYREKKFDDGARNFYFFVHMPVFFLFFFKLYT